MAEGDEEIIGSTQRCLVCERGTATLSMRRKTVVKGDENIHFHIPAWLCDTCGEGYEGQDAPAYEQAALNSVPPGGSVKVRDLVPCPTCGAALHQPCAGDPGTVCLMRMRDSILLRFEQHKKTDG